MFSKTGFYKKICVILAFASASSLASAAPLNIANVTASNTFFSYDLNNLTNGVGLTGNLHDGVWSNKWLAVGDTATLVFDFGALMNLTDTSIWNYGPGCCDAARSVKDLGISYSLDNMTYTNLPGFVLTNPVTDPFAAQVIELNIDARYVKFSLNSSHGGNAGFIGLSEVQFNGAPAAVPEPASLGLLGLGMAGLAASRRRARQNKQA